VKAIRIHSQFVALRRLLRCDPNWAGRARFRHSRTKPGVVRECYPAVRNHPSEQFTRSVCFAATSGRARGVPPEPIWTPLDRRAEGEPSLGGRMAELLTASLQVMAGLRRSPAGLDGRRAITSVAGQRCFACERVNGWIAFATMALTGYKNSLVSGLGDPLNAFTTVVDALNKHFHFGKVDDPGGPNRYYPDELQEDRHRDFRECHRLERCGHHPGPRRTLASKGIVPGCRHRLTLKRGKAYSSLRNSGSGMLPAGPVLDRNAAGPWFSMSPLIISTRRLSITHTSGRLIHILAWHSSFPASFTIRSTRTWP
jgi:hypothetical protein